MVRKSNRLRVRYGRFALHADGGTGIVGGVVVVIAILAAVLLGIPWP
jgi:hypothetical protein